MTIANNNDIKVTNGKFYIYSRSQNRFFPIAKIEAEEMISNGTAQYFKPC